MKPGLKIFWWGFDKITRRPFWLSRHIPLPGGNVLAWEFGIGPLSVARVVEP